MLYTNVAPPSRVNNIHVNIQKPRHLNN